MYFQTFKPICSQYTLSLPLENNMFSGGRERVDLEQKGKSGTFRKVTWLTQIRFLGFTNHIPFCALGVLSNAKHILIIDSNGGINLGDE